MNNQQSSLCLLLASGDWWRQTLIYPIAGTTQTGVLFRQDTGGCTLWFELNTRIVWGLSINGGSSLITFHELELIAKLLESCSAREFAETLKRISALTGRTMVEAPSAGKLAKLSRSITGSCASAYENMEPGMCNSQIKSQKPTKSASETDTLSGVKQFHAGLDREALSATGRCLLEDVSDIICYNYFFHPIPSIQHNRRQAAVYFPWMVETFNDISKVSKYDLSRQGQELYQLKESIDGGIPLIPVIAKHFGAKQQAVHFLVGKGFELIGYGWHRYPGRLLEIISLLKADRYPKTVEDWRLLNHWLTPLLPRFGYPLFRLSPIRVKEWFNELTLEGYPAIPKRLAAYGVNLSDIESIPDFEKALVQWAKFVNPDFIEQQAHTALESYGVLRLAVLSHWWSVLMARWMGDGRETTSNMSLGWPTVIDKPWIYGNLVVVPLNNAVLLREECCRLSLFPDSYTSQNLLVGSQLFSIREAVSGEPLAIVELELVRHEGIWRFEVLVDHAANYDLPTAECQLALRAFLLHLESTVPQKSCADLYHKLQQLRWNSGHYEELLQCLDWNDNAVAEFRELLKDYPLLKELEGLPQ